MNRHFQFVFKICRACFPAAIGLMLSLGSTMHAHASAPNASQAATKYVECGKPLLRENSSPASLGKAGFRIDVSGESYFFDTDERVLISFESADSSGAVAHVKLDQPPVALFREQAIWRERFMQDVAERSSVELERTTPGPGLTLFTVNKSSLKGKFVGISLLIDAVRGVAVQWDWDMSDRYGSINDVKALQDKIWKRLVPCLGTK